LVLSCSMDVLCFLLKPSISPQDGDFTMFYQPPPGQSLCFERGVRGVTFTASLQLGQDWCSKLMHSDGWIQPQIQVGFVGKQTKLEGIPKSSGLSYHVIPLLYMCLFYTWGYDRMCTNQPDHFFNLPSGPKAIFPVSTCCILAQDDWNGGMMVWRDHQQNGHVYPHETNINNVRTEHVTLW
jgi:hypothetical protein